MNNIIKFKKSFYLFNSFTAITIYPFIIVFNHNSSNENIILNHEKIHLKQYNETLIIGFLPLYFIFWIFNLIKYRNFDKAYRNIPFEKESYENENNLSYISDRKKYNWLKYLKKKK